MKVLKFGGTSVGTPQSLRNVKAIVESCEERIIVVVSALGGITDRLILTAREAEKGSRTYLPMFEEICNRHHAMIQEMVPDNYRDDVTADVNALFAELSDIYLGVSLLRELSERSLDRIVSYGERLSSTIIERVIEGAVLRYAPGFIRTVSQFGRHVLDNDFTHDCVAREFAGASEKITLVGGFISSDASGRITNLGRGGSDYTAAILAAELNADSLEIWTDVDGFMTADPRIIPGAKVIDELSFVEAMELCNFGAKVIYPPTIYPVFHRNIPIYIKNTFNPSYPGTRIADIEATAGTEPAPGGVSSITDTCLLCLTAPADVDSIESRMINALSRNGVSVFLTSRPAGCDEICCAISAGLLDSARKALNSEFSAELETGELAPLSVTEHLATIALVGERINTGSGGIRRLICDALHNSGISPVTLPSDATESTISFMVGMDSRVEALRVLHKAIFETDI